MSIWNTVGGKELATPYRSNRYWDFRFAVGDALIRKASSYHVDVVRYADGTTSFRGTRRHVLCHVVLTHLAQKVQGIR